MKKIFIFLSIFLLSFGIKAQIVQFQTTANSFPDLFYGCVLFADVDGDGDQDIFMCGGPDSPPYNEVSQLYMNNGSGHYTLKSGTPFTNVVLGVSAFADIDNDGDQDLLITGSNSSVPTRIAKLYTNDGLGNFTLVSGTPFIGVYISDVAFADVDNDNDQDVLIVGKDNSNNKICNLYKNNGIGNYTLATGTPFNAVDSCSIAFADIDGDMDQDVLIAGASSSGLISELYRNDGSGNYTIVTGTPFPVLLLPKIAFTDIDNDTDLDLFFSGWDGVNNILNLYSNDGNGNYTLVTGTPFISVGHASINFADVDTNGTNDVLLSGYNTQSSSRVTKLYTNDGNGNYTLLTGTPFTAIDDCYAAFGDIDNDGDPDLLMCGAINGTLASTALYRNTSCNISTGIDTHTACDSYTWMDGNTYSNSNNTATYLLASVGGCDSTVTLNLTINPSNSGDTLVTACDYFTWHGATHHVSNDFIYILQNEHGCDSTVTLHLTINNSNTGDTTVATCDNFMWYGINYNTTGNYTHILQNITGCDSTITMHLTINHIVGDTTASSCQHFTWYGNTYNSSGDYTKILPSTLGCDSTVTLHLTINTTNTVTDVKYACDSLIWIDGNTYTASNSTATYLLTNLAGCDSLVTLHLTIATNVNVTQNGIKLTAYPGNATYQWLDCTNGYIPLTGANSQVYTAINNGDYAVKVIQNGCIDTSACYSVTTAGIESYTQSTYKLYPNPVKNELTIENQGDINQIELYNLIGQLLQKVNSQSAFIKIDFSAYEQGVYFVKLNNVNEQTTTVRIVKE